MVEVMSPYQFALPFKILSLFNDNRSWKINSRKSCLRIWLSSPFYRYRNLCLSSILKDKATSWQDLLMLLIEGCLFNVGTDSEKCDEIIQLLFKLFVHLILLGCIFSELCGVGGFCYNTDLDIKVWILTKVEYSCS